MIYFGMVCHTEPYNVMLCYTMLCNVMSFRVMLCRQTPAGAPSMDGQYYGELAAMAIACDVLAVGGGVFFEVRVETHSERYH